MKKIISCDVTTIENIISDDRMNMSGNFKELLITDLEKVLTDYFDLTCDPILNVTKNEGRYIVTVECCALRVKLFGTIPK